MREFMITLLPREVILWILSWSILIIYGIKKILSVFLTHTTSHIQSTIHTIDAWTLHTETQHNEEWDTDKSSLHAVDVTEKLLQHIDIETQDQDKQTWNDTLTQSMIEVNKDDNAYDPGIYKIKTNIEQVNKQSAHYEHLTSQIDNLKAKNLLIEYEKKLIEATMDFPDDILLNSMLWDRYIEQGDFKKAQTLYKKLHIKNEHDDKLLYKLSIINMELGDLQSAEFLLIKARDLKPENPKYYELLAEIYYNLERLDDSIEAMSKAVDLRPNKFEYIEILWKLYKETDNIQWYYKALLKMNALEPLNQKIKAELAHFN